MGWEAAFVVLAVGTFLLAFPHAFVWRPRPPGEDGTPVVRPGPGSRGRAVAAVAVTSLWAFSVYSLYTFLSVFLHADGRASAVTWLLVAYGVGAVVGGQVGGRFADRAGAVRVSAAALALTAVLEVGVALACPVTWALACALGLFACAGYAFFPAQQRHLVDLFPERSTTVLSWNNSALFVGLSLAGAVGGQVVHTVGYPALLYIGAAVAAAAFLLACGRPARAHRQEVSA
ncbi:MFS transporter [Streptomyces sp. NPDC052013]|uniref:MFS transporter n=1 Tax=Streptomyces sp. NPDC052013 TaxID=3365679 RepID=UPI0037CCC90A